MSGVTVCNSKCLAYGSGSRAPYQNFAQGTREVRTSSALSHGYIIFHFFQLQVALFIFTMHVFAPLQQQNKAPASCTLPKCFHITPFLVLLLSVYLVIRSYFHTSHPKHIFSLCYLPVCTIG